MPRRTFTRLNMVGAPLWAVGIVTVGFYFGGIPFVAAHIELITVTVTVLSLVPPIADLLRRRQRRTVCIANDEDVDAERHDSPGLGASV